MAIVPFCFAESKATESYRVETASATVPIGEQTWRMIGTQIRPKAI